MSSRRWLLLAALGALAAPAACSARGGGGGGPLPTDDAGGDDTPVATDDTPVATNDGTATCPSPQRRCGEDCVDVTSDANNCGACGRRCSSDQSCQAGTCRGTEPTCAAPRMMCGASCADVGSDVANCGACGRRCGTGQTCQGGTCRSPDPTCASPRVMCGSSCVDVSSDASNCGLCGFACASGQRCAGGNCTGGTTGCTAPRTMCGTTCTDTSFDTNNCGTCGVRCATGQSCSSGRCSTTTGGTRAGAACTNPDPMGGEDPACGALVCVPSQTTPICTDGCTNSSSQATEQSMCGGTGSTCLTQGDGDTANSLCTASCRVSATPGTSGSCRTGFVCTGWWYTHAGGMADATGCFPFCSSDAQCGAGARGSRCNVRTGACGTSGANLARLPDGSPCNPTITETVPGETTPRNTQCRGICFRTSSTSMTQGLCGSFLNVANGSSCPDDPSFVQPLAPMGTDNLALCLFRACTRNADCRSPLICRYQEQAGVPQRDGPTLCDYPTSAQSAGIP